MKDRRATLEQSVRRVQPALPEKKVTTARSVQPVPRDQWVRLARKA